ncbi:MAG: permease-like cell division protein FtsX [Clostridia bacterium]|nr:permease-like cell division protein FtsX [Clostridia bacterium]
MKIRLYNITYFFTRAFQGIVRNGLMSLAAVIVLASSILVMGCAWALKVNTEHNLEEINEYNKIVVFVEKETQEHTVKLLKEKIEKLDSVESVEWITKDEVLKGLFKQYGDYSDILEMYNADNPCKDELVITYTDPSKVDTIVYHIQHMSEQEETLNSVAKINARKEVAEKIDSIKNVASLILTWLMVLLGVVSVFIIMNTIKLAVAYRSEEIKIMRYVGASAFFVAFPFVLEGIIIGLLSAGIAYGLQYYIYQIFAISILGGIGIIDVLPFSSMWSLLLIAFLAIGVGLGVIGSLISLRKYNKA